MSSTKIKDYLLLRFLQNQCLKTYRADATYKNIYIDNEVSMYKIGNDGSVKSSSKKQKDKPMKPQISRDGYAIITLRHNDKLHTFAIHRLVALAFIPNDDPEHKTQVNHINGIKYDNRVENLEWVTPSQNVLHAIEHGLHKIEGENPQSIYPVETIHKVCKLLETIDSPLAISKLLNVSTSLVISIKRRYTWKNISAQYNIPYVKTWSHNVLFEHRDEIINYIKQNLSAKEILDKLGFEYTDKNRRYIYGRKHDLKELSSTTIDQL